MLALLSLSPPAIVTVFADGLPALPLGDTGMLVSPPLSGWEDHGFKIAAVTPAAVPAGKQIAGPSTYQLVDGAPIEILALEDLPAPTAADVDAERDRRLEIGAPVTLTSGTSFVVQTDARSQSIIGNLALAASLAQARGQDTAITFRDAANIGRTLNAAETIAMAEQALTFVSTVYAASWALRDATPIPSDYAADQHWPASA